MISNLQIGIWMGYRLDKEASRELTERAHADHDAARVNKHLVPKEALKPVIGAANAVRTHFYDKTLPWKDNGDRVLTRKMYTKFIEKHEELVRYFHEAVERFLSVDYGAARERAAFRMGELFNSGDYPSVLDLQRRFYVHLDIDAVTEAGDFRVEMDEKHLASVRKNIENATHERLGRAMQDVWSRLAETLGHFAEKMGSDEIFRDSTVRNLEEIVELLPELNILNDANLEKIRQDIAGSLVGYEPKNLRKDPDVRNMAATEAKRIMDNMRGFMQAFGQAAE
tara:strand:+ start:1718 stop:2563 length:846 start_codon:yes stop_codon:yes gene_type:complete